MDAFSPAANASSLCIGIHDNLGNLQQFLSSLFFPFGLSRRLDFAFAFAPASATAFCRPLLLLRFLISSVLKVLLLPLAFPFQSFSPWLRGSVTPW
jgi:hypothetical protein